MNLWYIANVRLPTTRAHGIQILKTCEAFARAGVEVTLVVPDKRNHTGETSDPFAYYGVQPDFRIIRVPSLDLLGTSTSFGGLFFILDFVSFLISLTLRCRVPADAIIYTRDPVLFLPFLGAKRRAAEIHGIANNALFFPLLKTATDVFALTSLLKEDLAVNGIQIERISVAPDGIDLEEFAHPAPAENVRTRLGIDEDAKVALYIGRLDGWKGVDTLLAAARLLPDSIRVVIIGGQEEEVARLQSENPRVLFLGGRPYRELADNQQAADVLILPNTAKESVSARHTSPLKLFSYMTSGKPIVASDLPSLREVLSDVDAYFVAPDNAQALASGIEEALSNPEEAGERAASAQAKVRAYAWSHRANTILERLRS
ncbi:MAG: N-acetyllactosaminide 3-alpha-galactosyltransferase [Parcubacteria bacterium C7867-004]|nr:MAG: N-acetyllactosaminide 3-alpha-galactosyltransferase [Parcubacteria bacterium C7867-004]